MSKILNTTNISLSYSPGNSAYGQKGCSGNAGENGSSVYYASYIIKNNESLFIEQLRTNKEFSNSLNVENDIPYIANDIVIDSNGTIYKIYIDVDENLSAEKIGFLNEKRNDINVYVDDSNISAYIDSSISNKKYSDLYNSCVYSPIVAQRFYTNGELPGLYVKFNIELKEEIKNEFAITYNIYLPNGEILSYQNDFDPNDDHGIFISLGFLYGLYDFKDEHVEGESDITLKDYMREDDTWFYNEFNDEKIVKTAANYISNKCTASVEIANVLTGDIFVSKTLNINNIN